MIKMVLYRYKIRNMDWNLYTDLFKKFLTLKHIYIAKLGKSVLNITSDVFIFAERKITYLLAEWHMLNV
jgi:hypothetical protein